MQNPPSINLVSGLSDVVAYLRCAGSEQIWNQSLLQWESDASGINSSNLIGTAEILPYAGQSQYILSKSICDVALNASTCDSLQVRFFDSVPTPLGKAEYSEPFLTVPTITTGLDFLQSVDLNGNDINGGTDVIRGSFVVPKGIQVSGSSANPNFIQGITDDGSLLVASITQQANDPHGSFLISPSTGDDYVDVILTTTVEQFVRKAIVRVNRRRVIDLGVPLISETNLTAVSAADRDLILTQGGAGPWGAAGGGCLTQPELDASLAALDVVTLERCKVGSC